MKFTLKQGRRVKNACVLVVLMDVFLLADKHPALGIVLAIPAAIVMTYVYFNKGR
jgi:hypothetical protein